MVRISLEDRARLAFIHTSALDSNNHNMETEEAMGVSMMEDNGGENSSEGKIQSPCSMLSNNQHQASGSNTSAALAVDHEDSSPDEEQLRRILTCKRLSEGCNRFGSSFIQRKNSCQLVDELPPLTEGEAMKHMSYHVSQNIDSVASSGSSGSLRQGSSMRAQALRDLALKRGSQDETTSCSSSLSLERSPTRRRSSTVSQASSVLSEATRNQLNFDLSPDLPPDSSLMEANAVSPTDLDRPDSPEPFSQFSGREDGDLSPIDDSMTPDSMLNDSNADYAALYDHEHHHMMMIAGRSVSSQDNMEYSSNSGDNCNDHMTNLVASRRGKQTPDNLERLITDVRGVKVSNSSETTNKNTGKIRSRRKRLASEDSGSSSHGRASRFEVRTARVPVDFETSFDANSNSVSLSPELARYESPDIHQPHPSGMMSMIISRNGSVPVSLSPIIASNCSLEHKQVRSPSGDEEKVAEG